MKKSELKEVLRGVVKEVVTEEMYKVLPGIINESLTKALTQGSVSPVKQISAPKLNENVISNVSGLKVNRSAINNILQETAASGVRNQPTPGESALLNEGMVPVPRSASVGGVPTSALPSHLSKAFTRDYSEVLKRANEIR